MKPYRLTTLLLWIGAAFFAFEFVLHATGSSLLEHDKIFLPTHDRYIALLALTYTVLLILNTVDFIKYRVLFIITMTGVGLAIANAIWIAETGGYAPNFGAITLDRLLGGLGLGAAIWYPLTWIMWALKK